MSTDERIERYLAAATAGLRADRELELEAQAKLRSQIEAQLAATAKTAAGNGAAADPVADVLAGLPPAATAAAELAVANGTRMQQRTRLRRLGRGLLIPAAVLAALYAADPTPLVNLLTVDDERIDKLGWRDNTPPKWSVLITLSKASWYPGNWPKRSPKLTPDQLLILKGDLRRTDPAQQQRAIWEAYPENKVYYHNYLTQRQWRLLTSDLDSDNAWAMAAIDEGRKLDLANARFDYILALRLLKQATTIDAKRTGKDAKGRQQYALSWIIKDRAKLDQAMALLRSGLAKPEFRRYGREMVLERLRLMAPPQNMADNWGQTIMVINTTTTFDRTDLRTLANASVLYAGQLVREGRTTEAEPFLNAWRTLAIQLGHDIFGWYEAGMIGDFAQVGMDHAAKGWWEAGPSAQAEQTRNQAERQDAPMANYHRHYIPQWHSTIETFGGLVALMWLYTPGQTLSSMDLAPERMVEYIQAERCVIGMAAIGLLLTMAVCALGYWRWRLAAADAADRPLLLLPGWRDTLRILACGTLLPMLAYHAYNRWLPGTSHSYSPTIGWPLMTTETLLFLLLLFGGILWLTAQTVRCRCRELGISVPSPYKSNFRWWTAVGLAGLLVAGLMGGMLAWPINLAGPANGVLIMLSLDLLAVVILVVLVLWTLLAGICDFGLYHGSLARTLIPCSALSLICLSLLGKSYLNMEEARWVRCDTVVRVDPDGYGYSLAEGHLVRQLTAAIRQAAETLPPAPRIETQK
ncbi:MAG: hypothetical protein WCH61_01380 [bacterium]